MKPRQTLISAVGVLALAAAAVAVVAPEMVPISVVGRVEELPPDVLLAALSVFGALVLLVALGGRTAYRTLPLVERREASPNAPALGATFDVTLERATDTELLREQRVEAQDDVRAELRTLAIETYRQKTDCPGTVATRVVDTGTWTDDPRAVAFLGSDEAPRLPLHLWLFDLFRSEPATRRRVRHTVAAIDEVRRAARGDLETVHETPPGDTDGAATSTVREGKTAGGDGNGELAGDDDAPAENDGEVAA